jgi:hypothetical protein
MNDDWFEGPNGSLVAMPRGGSTNKFSQPDPGDVHIPTAIKRKRRDQCMLCGEPPTVEVVWAEGEARAWFCDTHYREWKAESRTHRVMDERQIEGGSVPQRWSGYEQELKESASYAEVSGIKGRQADTRAGKATNEYQGLLTAIYDRWVVKAQNAILAASAGNRRELVKEVDKQLLLLARRLKDAARTHLQEAFEIGAKGELDRETKRLLSGQVEENDRFVDSSLIPRLRAKILGHLDDIEEHQYQLDATGLWGLLLSMRSEPSGYAGAFYRGLFIAAGLMRQKDDKERIESGAQPRRVRWALDPTAEHCKHSDHGYGCPELVGEYQSWDDLPTVPAGKVTCLGNCRCHIEVENDSGGWDRMV